MIELGQLAKDAVTGFEGVITGRAQYLYGCDQYCIVPRINKDGKMGESQWFDEGRIRIIGPWIQPKDVQVDKPGGPNRDCPKNSY